MRRIIIDGYGIFVGCKGDRIVIKKKGKKLLERAAVDVAQVMLCTRGITLSSAFLRLALRHGVDIVILSEAGIPLGRLSRLKKGGVKVRKEQFRAQNDYRGVHLAKQMAKAKVINQRTLLRQLARTKARANPALAREVMGIVYEMDEHVENIEAIEGSSVDEVRANIMYEEARAANKYWSCIKVLLADIVEFPGRKKRFDRPSDPVNILLNYGYYVLAASVWLSVDSTPLDPYIGFLHIDSSRRPALVMDLMEEFRQPVVDRAVFNVIKQGTDDLLEGGRLTPVGRRRLLEALTERLKSKITFKGQCLPIETHVLLQARRICRFLVGKISEYVPFTPR